MYPYLKPPKLTSSVWKVWRRNLNVFMRTYRVNFLAPFLEPVLYLLSLGFGLGFFIQNLEGVTYIKFIAPSLLAISVMNTAFFECTYSTFVRMYYQKTFDAIIATPLNMEEVIAGELLWGATRSLINACLIFIVIVVFGLVELPLGLIVIPFSFLAGLMFATIAMCFTAITPSIDALNYPFFIFVTPMFLFSGTFFPLSIFPSIFKDVAFIALPLVHVVNISRALTLNRLDIVLLASLAWIVIVAAILFVVSVNLMKKRLIV